MNKKTLAGAVIAIGMANAFSVALAADTTITVSDNQTAAVQCYGVNSCKGKGSCKTANNSCRGQNSCKGQGVMQMSKADCDKQGGKAVG